MQKERDENDISFNSMISISLLIHTVVLSVIFYNYYLNVVKNMAMEMDNFASEILNIIERNYVRK